MKQIIFYTALNGRCYIREWLSSIRSYSTIEKIMSRMDRIKDDNLGDHKSLNGGLYELRFRNGLRIYYTVHQKTIVVLFKGGNKKGQSRDISKARELLAEFMAHKEGSYE